MRHGSSAITVQQICSRECPALAAKGKGAAFPHMIKRSQLFDPASVQIIRLYAFPREMQRPYALRVLEPLW